MTSLAKARRAGILRTALFTSGGRLGGRATRLPAARSIHESHPQNAVLKAVTDLVGGDGKAFDAIELYSCFPCVPKMARRTLGFRPRRTAYGDRRADILRRAAQHLHDACGLRDGAQAARRRKARPALRQGGFVTKHHGLVLSREPPQGPLAQDTSVQTEADRHRGAVPEFVTEASGKGAVESFTVIYGRNGNVEHGVVMLRTPTMPARWRGCPPRDGATLAHLLNMDRTPVDRQAISSAPMMVCWSGGSTSWRARPAIHVFWAAKGK